MTSFELLDTRRLADRAVIADDLSDLVVVPLLH
jgi:hypothetical protein